MVNKYYLVECSIKYFIAATSSNDAEQEALSIATRKGNPAQRVIGWEEVTEQTARTYKYAHKENHQNVSNGFEAHHRKEP